ncbi:MAG: PEP-utilizing enzyme [Patescibacteria group bacterium]
MNQEDIGRKVGQALQNSHHWLSTTLKLAQSMYHQISLRLRRSASGARKNPKKFISLAINEFPRYFISLGIYSALMRYLGDAQETRVLPRKSVVLIAKQRDQVGRFYSVVEGWLRTAMGQLGKPLHLKPELLLAMTRNEMNFFLNGRALSKKQIRGLRQRTRGFVYLLRNNQETVQADNRAARSLLNNFFNTRGQKVVSGHVAHPGIVRGIVFNILLAKSHKRPARKNKIILVSPMTHPDDIRFIRRCSAIVTDEGGMLSHAAVVARELGIPCIIGTKIATKVFKDGDKIEVDAYNGVVRKI